MQASDLETLDKDGVLVLDNLLPETTLRSMQESFAARLRLPRFSDIDGYEQTESFRHMVQDLLTLDQGFLDLALHPTVLRIVTSYLGPGFELCEAKGWKSIATRQEFHGWHGDAWYDQEAMASIPRELKLAVYLSPVESGEFQYVRGSHRQYHPRAFKKDEVDAIDPARIASFKGPAGTAILFDTSGIHRQASPILEDRCAIFLAYHDSRVPLQPEDRAYHRYHPLLLNAAFLADLSPEHQRILGFGGKRNYVHAFEREVRFPRTVRAIQRIWHFRLRLDQRLRPWLRRLGR